MKQYLLLTSALVASGLLNSGVANAACIKTPTCSSLGYESTTSCTGGVKCPFGNAWNCTASDLNNKISEITNKITTIEEKIVKIEKENATSNCKIGDILYSDKSCNANVVASKTPIGVVFDTTNKLAIGLEEIVSNTFSNPWTGEYFDVPSLPNITTDSAAIADWQGKNNTRLVLEYCKANGQSCPAFEYVNSYKTEGTIAGDWYLPAMGELNAIYENRDVLNTALGKVGGITLDFSTWSCYWSSSEYSKIEVWEKCSGDYLAESVSKYGEAGYSNITRPVLAF